MVSHIVDTQTVQCTDCAAALEIAAVSRGFFRGATMLLSCPHSGFMREDSSTSDGFAGSVG